MPIKINQRVREHAVLNYFTNHYAHYGFSNAVYNGVGGIGYDFTLTKDGLTIYAELETKWENYLLHKHHQDSRFSQVSLLILLSEENPPTGIVELPPSILHIDLTHFFSVCDKQSLYKHNKKRVSRTVRMPISLHNRITELANTANISKSAWVIKALEQKAFRGVK